MSVAFLTFRCFLCFHDCIWCSCVASEHFKHIGDTIYGNNPPPYHFDDFYWNRTITLMVMEAPCHQQMCRDKTLPLAAQTHTEIYKSAVAADASLAAVEVSAVYTGRSRSAQSWVAVTHCSVPRGGSGTLPIAINRFPYTPKVAFDLAESDSC